MKALTKQQSKGTSKGKGKQANSFFSSVRRAPFFSPNIQMVPDESGIEASTPRYNYSTNCGWIDWSHANPGMTRGLIEAVRNASAEIAADPSKAPLNVTTPAMNSAPGGVVLTSVTPQVLINRTLSEDEILSVALQIYRIQSLNFEALQSWTNWVGNSSFSEEDLPSNLIAFYRAARGFDRPQIESICDVWNSTRSLAKYEDYNFQENRTFRPLSLPTGGSWPSELATVHPADPLGPQMEYLSLSTFTGWHGTRTINVRDQLWLESGQMGIQPVGSSSTTVDLSNTESGSEHAPHFEISPLPGSTDMVFRWNIAADRGPYRMWGDDGQVHQYGAQSNAYIGSRTRAMLIDRGITSGTINCRVAADSSGSRNQLLQLPVTFTW